MDDQPVIGDWQAPGVAHGVRIAGLIALAVAAGPDLPHRHVVLVHLVLHAAAEIFVYRQTLLEGHGAAVGAVVEQDHRAGMGHARVVLVARPQQVAHRGEQLVL